MKNCTYALFLIGLLCLGLAASSVEKIDDPAAGELIGELLRAHNVSENGGALSASSNEAMKIISFNAGGEMPRRFKRKVSVFMDGKAFKRHTADPKGLRERFDLFDGRSVYRKAVYEHGKLAEEVNQTGEVRFEGVDFSVETFGLVPVLRLLSDPATRVVYLGRTGLMEDKFEVRPPTGRWVLYADQSHLISRIEVGDKTIAYSDYRNVGGVRLPFIQKLSINGLLAYELAFTRIELNQTFPPDYYSREEL